MNILTKQFHEEVRVINFTNLTNPEKPSGCIDLLPFTITQYTKDIPGWSSDRGHHVAHSITNQKYPDGTWILRKSGEYEQSQKIISMLSTNNKLAIRTDSCICIFQNVTNFLRKIKNDNEEIVDTYWNGNLTSWSLEERNQVFHLLLN
jgi:hypothetical protein